MQIFSSTLSFDHYVICSNYYYNILMVIFYLPHIFYIYYLEFLYKEDMSLLYSYQCVFIACLVAQLCPTLRPFGL